MKYLTALLFALPLIWAGGAQAAESEETMGKIKNNPIEIAGGTSPRMTVIFSHKSHSGKGISCKNCHHESSSDTAFSSCTEACHATPGARERDPMSMFMAFHAKNTDRSCYGCHSRLAEKSPALYPGFKGCRPCHMTPAARADAEAAKKAKKK